MQPSIPLHTHTHTHIHQQTTLLLGHNRAHCESWQYVAALPVRRLAVATSSVCVCAGRSSMGTKGEALACCFHQLGCLWKSQSQKEGGYDPKLFHSLRYHALPYADPSSPALIAANQQPAALPPLSCRSWNGPTHTTGLARPMGKPLSTSPPLPLHPNRPLTDGRWPWLLDLHVFFFSPKSSSQQHPISPRPTRSREPDGSDNVGFSRRAIGAWRTRSRSTSFQDALQED